MHPFWTRLRAVIGRGELIPADVAEWFDLDYDKAFFWSRMLKGHRGPWPMSDQRHWYKRLDQLEMAVEERVFPLQCKPRQRRQIVGEILAKYHKRIPVRGFTKPGMAPRLGRAKRPLSAIHARS